MGKAGSKGGKGRRRSKIGRNLAKCQAYRNAGRRERNRERKALKREAWLEKRRAKADLRRGEELAVEHGWE